MLAVGAVAESWPTAALAVLAGGSLLLAQLGHGLVGACLLLGLAFRERLGPDPQRAVALWVAFGALAPITVAGYLPPVWAGACAAPALVGLTRSLRRLEPERDSGFGPLTGVAARLLAVCGLYVAVGLLLRAPALATAGALMLAVLCVMVGRGVWWLARVEPRVGRVPRLHVRLGEERVAPIGLDGLGDAVASLATASWAAIDPPVVEGEGTHALALRIAPVLAGPHELRLEMALIDELRLVRRELSVALAEVVAVPRARYAAWLAEQFLAGRPAALPSSRTVSAAVGTAFRRSARLEYRTNRPFQPGDSVRDVDWKRSARHRKLIAREFDGEAPTAGIVAVNLETRDAEEADKLALDLMSVAITLGQMNLAVDFLFYAHEPGATTVRQCATPAALVREALAQLPMIRATGTPPRLLGLPDLRWLEHVAAAGVPGTLRALVAARVVALHSAAERHPVLGTKAMAASLEASRAVLFLTTLNHDFDAVAVRRAQLQRLGVPVTVVTPGLSSVRGYGRDAPSPLRRGDL